MLVPDGALARAAAALGLEPDALSPCGRDAAKLELVAPDAPPRGRLVLVSAITPTAAGEGKTTTAIGLRDGLRRIGHVACAALRQPSQAPVFGQKGGGTGGGLARLVPAERIDLHFTGDLHAIAAAHNLLAAMIDNGLHFGALDVEPDAVRWPRVLDVGDRALRAITTGQAPGGGPPRQTGFVLTAASEVMACLCLARDADDLRARLGRMIVAVDRGGAPVTAADVGAVGAMMALLGEALHPNLVTTREGTPALVHGGPFANIAHGCSSVLATRLALAHAEWVVTEAGFGFDLGGEKFFDLVAPAGGFEAAAVVLVATVRALRAHGGDAADPLTAGLDNLDHHVAAVERFDRPAVIAVNRRADDDPDAIAQVVRWADIRGVPCAVADPYGAGGDGCLELARAVVAAARPGPARPPYAATDPAEAKLTALAAALYGAAEVRWTERAKADLAEIARHGGGTLPPCVAKTPTSLTDDPRRAGRPRDHVLTVTGAHLSAGAGFWVALCGAITRMPGLPRRPRALGLDLVDGISTGLD